MQGAEANRKNKLVTMNRNERNIYGALGSCRKRFRSDFTNQFNYTQHLDFFRFTIFPIGSLITDVPKISNQI